MSVKEQIPVVIAAGEASEQHELVGVLDLIERDGTVAGVPLVATLDDGHRTVVRAARSELASLQGQNLVSLRIRLLDNGEFAVLGGS